MEIFQKRIVELRGEQTQKYVADKIGITEVSLSRYENGQRIPNIDILRKMAEYYKVSADYLIGMDSDVGNYEKLKIECEYLQRKLNRIKQIVDFEPEDYATSLQKAMERAMEKPINAPLLDLSFGRLHQLQSDTE